MKYAIVFALALAGCVDHAIERVVTASQISQAQVSKEVCLKTAMMRWDGTKDPADAIMADLRKCEASVDAAFTSDGGVK